MLKDKLYVYRADREYSGGDMVSGAPDKKTAPSSLRVHVGMGSRTDKTPYISTSSNIAAMQKYMSGKVDDNNSERAKVYLIVLDKMAQDEEYTDSSPYYDFSREEALSRYFGGELPDTIKNFGNADSEITVSRKIPGERVFEMHPILVDILSKIDIGGPIELGRKIQEKIIDSSLSVQKVNEFIESMIKNNKLNNFEVEFLRNYYQNRYMLNYSKEEAPDSIFARQCLRAQLLKTIVPELLHHFDIDFDEEYISRVFARGFFDMRFNENMRMTAAKKDNDHMFLKNYVVELKSESSIDVPYGMTYYCVANKEGKREVDSWKTYGIRVDRYIGETVVFDSPMVINNFEGPEYSKSSEVIERERNRYINDSKNSTRIRSYNVLGEGIVYYSFDQDDRCVKLIRQRTKL